MSLKTRNAKHQKAHIHVRSSKNSSSNLEKLTELIDQGNQLMENEEFELATIKYAKVLESQPSNYVALSNLGAALVRMGKYDDAKSILEYALEINPTEVNARINMGAVYQAKKEFHNGLRNALEAVACSPTSAVAFNNLGCAFGNVNMLNEALHAYQTAQILDPENYESALNVGMTQSDLNDPYGALKTYGNLLNKIPSNKKGMRDLVNFYSSFENLKIGELKKGWGQYECGFNPMIPSGRDPRRSFPIPQWQGEDLEGKKILIWREQGIGDELLFSSCLVDLMNVNAEIHVECSPRLVPTFKRSFPNFQIRPETFSENDGYTGHLKSYDFQTPVGSLPRILRSNLSDFNKQQPFIKIDIERKKQYHVRLKSRISKKMIGICWRSGLLDPLRNRHYTSLTDWKNILTLDEFSFVNLQYGDCETEIQEVENLFGIEIIRWDDLDLKNDFDGIFSLTSCLDAVITAPTAVCSISGSLGIPTLIITRNLPWDALSAPNGEYPWYKNTVISHDPEGQYASMALPAAPDFLMNLFRNH